MGQVPRAGERCIPSGRHRKACRRGVWARGGGTCSPLRTHRADRGLGGVSDRRQRGRESRGASPSARGHPKHILSLASSISTEMQGLGAVSGWQDPAAGQPSPTGPARPGGAGSVGRTSVGAPRGWASPPPPPPAHLGPAPTPSRVWCRRAGGKLQRTDEARRPSVRLLCFVNLFSNGERLRAVVRHHLGSSPLGEDVRPETRERVAPRTGPLRGSERGARRSVFEWRHIIS